jgi:hypothetical protein
VTWDGRDRIRDRERTHEFELYCTAEAGRCCPAGRWVGVFAAEREVRSAACGCLCCHVGSCLVEVQRKAPVSYKFMYNGEI